ncbi:HD domain-containing protein [Paenibacillus sp. chi10]|uniref:HD domain-containing protein n=1 Tax=Paenibacillus suaedae TaxID=3077233 RepID=A0AAJ2K1U8_9BACL|nr:HD domain-containing protein [Paenibacillus sp. chi10]MDT8978714.1 HD domain-containing protein [Paenibacillus sp. chi10]
MNLLKDLQLVRSIIDPIHGVIKLTMDEMLVIEDPLFRRLHHVRQNSFLYKVFPSAKHTRFEHSIGVMNYAHKMLHSIIENGYIAYLRGDIAEDVQSFEGGIGVNLGELLHNNGDALKETFIELRLAALLHDIGHGPLSHLFDAFAPNIEEFMEIMCSDELAGADKEFIDNMGIVLFRFEEKQKKKGKSDVRIEHEHVSSYFAYKVLSKIDGISKEQIRNVLTILKPELELGTRKIKAFNRDVDVLPLLNDIVASAPIDCDRMDYLKRDSYFAGVPYGDYSESRVLKSMLAYVNNEGDLRLGLKQSGLHAVENFLQARYEMYVQVYGHKTNEACRAMLNFVAEEKGLTYTSWSKKQLTAKEFEELYISLSDEQFIDNLLSVLSRERKDTLQAVKDRDLWKRIYEFEEFIDEKDKVTEISKHFAESFITMKKEFGEGEFREFRDERFPLKDMDSGALLLEKSSRGYYVVSPQKIREGSQIISSLNNGLRILRVYSIDSENATTFKKYASKNILSKFIGVSDRV